MKKEGLLLFCFLSAILLIFNVSAINIAYKENYSPKETLIAKISGDITQNINQEDIVFYKDYKEIPMEYEIANINGNYYLYALLPEANGNYSFVIKNITYIQGRVTKKETFENNFTISGNSTLQIFPGFMIASKTFSIYLENFGESGDFKAEFLNQEYPITILHNDASTVFFSIPEENFGYIIIYKGSSKLYEIPVKIIHQNQGTIDPSQLAFKDNEINISLKIDEQWKFTLELYNYASVSMNSVSLRVVDVEDYVSLEQEEASISPGTPANINITAESDEVGLKKGRIEAEYNGIIANISLNLLFTEENTTIPVSDSNSYTCTGTICPSEKTCSLSTYSIGIAECCPGICEDSKNDGGSSGWLTGLLIILGVLVVGIGIFYFVKKRSVRGDILKERSSKYEDILKGK